MRRTHQCIGHKHTRTTRKPHTQTHEHYTKLAISYQYPIHVKRAFHSITHTPTNAPLWVDTNFFFFYTNITVLSTRIDQHCLRSGLLIDLSVCAFKLLCTYRWIMWTLMRTTYAHYVCGRVCCDKINWIWISGAFDSISVRQLVVSCPRARRWSARILCLLGFPIAADREKKQVSLEFLYSIQNPAVCLHTTTHTHTHHCDSWRIFGRFCTVGDLFLPCAQYTRSNVCVNAGSTMSGSIHIIHRSTHFQHLLLNLHLFVGIACSGYASHCSPPTFIACG